MLPSFFLATYFLNRDSATEEMGFEEGTFTKLWVLRETKKVMKSCEIHGNRVVEFRTNSAMLMFICFFRILWNWKIRCEILKYDAGPGTMTRS